MATAPVATGIALHRWLGTWDKEVEVFIALTEFQKARLVQAGLPEERIYVKPNFCSDTQKVIPWSERDDTVVYAGRLSEEKGVQVLVDAWLQWGEGAPQLILLGDGPLQTTIKRKIERAGASNIRLFGHVERVVAQRLVGQSRLVIVPSLVTESFGLPVIEGFARGTPALVSDRGPLRDLAGHGGCSFRAGDSGDLYRQIKRLWASPEQLQTMGRIGRKIFLEKFTERQNHLMLMEIYNKAIFMGNRLNRMKSNER